MHISCPCHLVACSPRPGSRRRRGPAGRQLRSRKAQGGRPHGVRAHRRQHHARAETGRLSADRAPLVGRFVAPVFRMAPAGRRRGVDLGGRRATAAQPRKLTDEERRSAPPVNGALGQGAPPRALRRSAATSCCSIRWPARAARSRARPATKRTRDGRGARSAVTFARDNNLFIVPLDSGEIAQLTDVQPQKRDPRETDSQKFVKAEEQKLIEHTRVEAEKKKEGRGERQGARAAEVRARRSSVGDRSAALARRQARVHRSSSSAPETAKRPNVPNYVTESSYTEDIPARTFVGDAQDKRTLAVDEPRDRQDGDAALDRRRTPRSAQGREGRPARQGSQTRGGPLGHAAAVRRWRARVAHARATDNKDRWLVAVDPESARRASSTRCTTTRGCVRSAAFGADRSVVRLAAGSEAPLVPVGARRLDAPLQRRRDRAASRPRDS